MNSEYLKILDQFKLNKVLVIGDFILDVYLKGTSTRLSPEAPIPVVDVAEKVERIGGAGNVACNLHALGADVGFISVVGADEDGDKAVQLLWDAGIDTSGIVQLPERKTIVKTRVMCGSHVLTRFDCGDENSIDDQAARLVKERIYDLFSKYDAVLVSDYNKGVITESIRDTLGTLHEVSSKFIAVDSKRLDFFKTIRPTLVKPNYQEVTQLLGLPAMASARVEQLHSLGEVISAHTGAEITAVTMDAEGALVFQKDKLVCRSLAQPVTTPNVIGAGDTYISAFTLALCSGTDINTASEIATAAASVVVKKEGTSPCIGAELHAYFHMNEKLVNTLDQLVHLCEMYRAAGKRIVFTNGCFDILHSGHVNYLSRARELGDVLIVGINRDESIKRIKGTGRPINPLRDRVEVLAGLSAIHHVVPFGEETDDTPISLIKIVKPDIFVKGGDYTREALPEADTVEESGGKIIFLPHIPDHSTTNIINQIHKTSGAVIA